MKTKHYLTLSDAEVLLEQAQQVANEMGLNVSISVVDETGSLLTMKRLDGASPLTASFSLEKAKGSAISRLPSKSLEDMIKNGQIGILNMSSFSGSLEGGEPILYQGNLIGAVGVSGAQSFQDAEIARSAIDAFLAHVTQ